MKTLNLGRCAFSIGLPAALLAGCGALPLSLSKGQNDTLPASAASAIARSRILHDAHGRDLLYVGVAGSINVYTFPNGEFVGNAGFTGGAMCSNKAGDVFITQDYGLSEYPHGSSTQIAFISAPYGRAYSCSIDPTTGDLAMYTENPSTYGVAIYRPEHLHRWHFPRVYRFALPQTACAYDSAGDLFVGGFTSSNGFSLMELPKGSSAFETITLDTKVTPQGDIQWDGRYLAIGDFRNIMIHRFAIKGTKGTQIGSLVLSHAKYIGQFWIQGNILIGPGDYGTGIGFWQYPQGGNPLKRIKVRAGGGVTVSLARN